MHKILKKFLKEYFENKDNVIDKNLKEFIDTKQFNHRSDLRKTIR